MVSLFYLTKKILRKRLDHRTRAPEIILLGYSSNESASEHISRYVLASKLARGVVLDCASGSCYGSSILRRGKAIRSVISVDVDRHVLLYGKKVYLADCVCADASHLPFRDNCFDSLVSIETLEHIRDQTAFLCNIGSCLKRGGGFILSTPNKLYSSPFLPKPLNFYHRDEYYLGPLLMLLKTHSFKVKLLYGGKKMTSLESIRRISSSLSKFSLSMLSITPYLIDNVYYSILNPIKSKKEKATLLDPNPCLFPHIALKVASNVIRYRYFVILACRP